MTIILTPEHERIIRAQLATGQFRTVEEVLDKVLEPLKTQSPVRQTRMRRRRTRPPNASVNCGKA